MVKQQRAVETRETVVISAARVFAVAGYRSTTLKDIATEAGMTQGALYFHFGSKQELAAEIIRRQHAISIAAGQRHLTAATSGLMGMVLLSTELANQILTDPVVRAGLRLSTEPVDELRSVSQEPYSDWIATCREFLGRAERQDETREGLDLDAAAEVVIASFTGTQSVSAALSNSGDLRERLARMWPIVLSGIARDYSSAAITDSPQVVRSMLGAIG